MKEDERKELIEYAKTFQDRVDEINVNYQVAYNFRVRHDDSHINYEKIVGIDRLDLVERARNFDKAGQCQDCQHFKSHEGYGTCTLGGVEQGVDKSYSCDQFKAVGLEAAKEILRNELQDHTPQAKASAEVVRMISEAKAKKRAADPSTWEEIVKALDAELKQVNRTWNCTSSGAQRTLKHAREFVRWEMEGFTLGEHSYEKHLPGAVQDDSESFAVFGGVLIGLALVALLVIMITSGGA